MTEHVVLERMNDIGIISMENHPVHAPGSRFVQELMASVEQFSAEPSLKVFIVLVSGRVPVVLRSSTTLAPRAKNGTGILSIRWAQSLVVSGVSGGLGRARSRAWHYPARSSQMDSRKWGRVLSAVFCRCLLIRDSALAASPARMASVIPRYSVIIALRSGLVR